MNRLSESVERVADRRNNQIAYKKFARKRRKIKLLKVIITIIGLIAAIALFIYLCQAREISVSGNAEYAAEMIKSDIITNTFERNTLYQRIIGILKKRPEISYLDDYEIAYPGINKMVIKVYEKQPVAYLMIDQSCVLFSKDGVVLKISNEPPADIPRIEGLEMDTIILYQALQAKDTGVFTTVKNLVEIIKKNELNPDRILVNEESEIELYFGNVTVMLGTDDSIEDKIAKLIAIMPNLEGRNGILYMQDVDENTDEVSFIKTKP